MLPIPFIKNITKDLKKDSNPSGIALANKIDLYISEWKQEIKYLQYVFAPDLVPSIFLGALSNYLGVDDKIYWVTTSFLVDETGAFLADDLGYYLVENVVYSSEYGDNIAKRINIRNATKSYKNWDLFTDHIKPLIDNVTKYSCSLVVGVYPPKQYICIDIGDNGILGNDILDLVAFFVKQQCDLAYLQIKLGYINGLSVFVDTYTI